MNYNLLLEGPSMEEKITDFKNMFEYPEIDGTIEQKIEKCIQNSGIMDALTRLSARLDKIERHLGADDYHCIGEDTDYKNGISRYDEERTSITPIREQIKEIYTAIDSKTAVVENTTIVGGNKTETRARLLFDKLKDSPEIRGKKFMAGPDVSKWLLNEIEEKYRTTKNGSRQASQDVMEKTRELYPNEIKLYLVSDKQNRKRGKNIIEYVGIPEHVSMY